MKLKFGAGLLWAGIALIFWGCDKNSTSPQEPTTITTNWEKVGLDSTLILSLDNKIESGDYGSISSLIIYKNGEIAFENYYRGWKASNLHQAYSVTKTFACVLIGIAKDKGYIDDLDTPILSYFPSYEFIANHTAEKDSITLRHVLQMRTGLEWDELSVAYGTQFNPLNQMTATSDWVGFVLNRPMAEKPGTTFSYNSGASVLLAGVIEEATERNTHAFARDYLFEPLGISSYVWEQSPLGLFNTGFGLALLPRDMLKLGILILQDGKWEGVQIVSKAWLDEATQMYTTFENLGGYGYQTWIMRLEKDGTAYEIPYANGWGQQYVYVFRDLGMVVVSTAEKYQETTSPFREILANYLIPAAQ